MKRAFHFRNFILPEKYRIIYEKPPGTWLRRLIKSLWYDGLVSLIYVILLIFKEVAYKAPELEIESIPSKTGQVAVIFGGPRSLTFGIVKRLLQLDYTVIVGIKYIEECERKVQKLKALGLPTKNLKLIEVDYKSLKSVAKFAEAVLERSIRVDLLVCNAGIQNAPYELSDNGYEAHFQVNYLSQFLLTNLLLERLKYTSKAKDLPCQIIFVSSVGHFCARLDFLELEKTKIYNAMKCYFDSKLCQVTAMLTLDRVLKTEGANVNVFAVHPGMINVDLWDSIGLGSFFFGNLLCRSIESAADTILWPVFSTEFEDKGGLYLENGKAVTPSWEASNKYTQQRLWGRSFELIRKSHSKENSMRVLDLLKLKYLHMSELLKK